MFLSLFETLFLLSQNQKKVACKIQYFLELYNAIMGLKQNFAVIVYSGKAFEVKRIEHSVAHSTAQYVTVTSE